MSARLVMLGTLALLLALSMSTGEVESPYTEWVHQVARQFNRFRLDTDHLLEYHWDHQYAHRYIESRYQCWDDMDVLQVYGYDNCLKKGMWKEDAATKWGDFEEDVLMLSDAISEPLEALTWSDELALSAGWYMNDISGCNVWQPNIINDQPNNHYIRQIAEYKYHHRVVIYPERFEWKDTAELVWDLFMDDDQHTDMNLVTYLSPRIDSIGVACNCHPTFGQFCVFEFGESVEGIHNDSHSHEIEPYTTESGVSPFYHTHDMVIPQFRLPGDPRCETDSRVGVCNEVEESYTDTSDVEETVRIGGYDQLQGFTYDLFNEINDLRNDPIAYKERLATKYARHSLSRWDLNKTFAPLKWNNALAHAARHVVNEEGACETYGDINGNFIPEVLLRYYAYDYTDLEILKVTAIDMGYELDALEAMEYILAQDCIQKSIFKGDNLEFGIGCACSADERYSCYFVSANRVVGKQIIERIPEFQPIVDYENGERCQSYCWYKDMDNQWDENQDDQHSYGFFFDETSKWTCPEGSQFPSDNAWEHHLCEFCSDLYPGSSERCLFDEDITYGFEGEGLLECEGHYGVFNGHVWRPSLIDDRRRSLYGWGSDELAEYGYETSYGFIDVKSCDYPDCSDYLPGIGCTQCYQSEYLETVLEDVIVYNPIAKYLYEGACHIDCTEIEGANLVNNDEQGICVCNDETFEDEFGRCVPCTEIDPQCEYCATDEITGEPYCLSCNSVYQVPSPDRTECWNKIPACDIPLETQTWEFWNEDTKGMRLRDNGKYSCDSCMKGYWWKEGEDNMQGRCVRCPDHCEECASDERCFKCRDHFFLSPDKDYCQTETPYCAADVSEYTIWSFYDYDNNTDDHPEDWEHGFKKWRCPECVDGYYLTDDGECTTCSAEFGANCMTCNQDVCLSCSAGNVLLPDQSGCTTELTCEVGPEKYEQYYDLLPVPLEDNYNFLRWKFGDDLASGNRENQWMCPVCDDDMTWSWLSSQCVLCSSVVSNCNLCDMDGTCQVCDTGYVLTPDRLACMEPVDNCADSPEDYTLFEWSFNFNTYTNTPDYTQSPDSRRVLDDCDFDEFIEVPMTTWMCNNCEKGTYWTHDNNPSTYNILGWGCVGFCDEALDERCEECSHDGTQCLSCEDGYMVDADGIHCTPYIDHCENAPIEDQPYHVSGLEADGEGHWACTTCEDGYYWDVDDLACTPCGIEWCTKCHAEIIREHEDDDEDDRRRNLDGHVGELEEDDDDDEKCYKRIICDTCIQNKFPNVEGNFCRDPFHHCQVCEEEQENGTIEYDFPMNDEGDFYCPKCDDGFYWSQGLDDCTDCGMVGCLTCERGGECTKCDLGYHLNGQKQCEVSGLPHCAKTEENDRTTCEICVPGFALNVDGQCDPTCHEWCAECDWKTHTCHRCLDHTKLVVHDDGSTTCEYWTPGCNDFTVFSDSVQCNSCENGYGLAWAYLPSYKPDPFYRLEGFTGSNLNTCIRLNPIDHCEVMNSYIPTASSSEYFFYLEDKGCLTCEPGYQTVTRMHGDAFWNKFEAILPSQKTDLFYEDCERVPIDNCEIQDGAECEKCDDGYFWDNCNEYCKPCDLSRCTECTSSPYSKCDEDGPAYETCLACENGYALTMQYVNHDPNLPRLVCDYPLDMVSRRRSLHCLVSDAEDDSGCAQCDDTHYFNELSSNCESCSKAIRGCDMCNHEGTECLSCGSSYELVDGQCLQIDCRGDQVQMGSSIETCTDCSDLFPGCGSCSIENGEPVCHECSGSLTFLQNGDSMSCGCDHVSFPVIENGDYTCELCMNVIDGCTSCSDESTCNECIRPYFLAPDGSCQLDNCFERDIYGDCVSCNSINEFKLLLQEGKCVQSCQNGYHSNGQGKCVKEGVCDKDCGECNDRGECLSCKPGKHCDLSCPAPLVHDYKLGKCVDYCDTKSAVSQKSIPGIATAPWCTATKDATPVLIQVKDLGVWNVTAVLLTSINVYLNVHLVTLMMDPTASNVQIE